MRIRIASLALAFVAAVVAIPSSPTGGAAQCKWGCKCMETSCACNSFGDGGRCDASGSGCVVSGCIPTNMAGDGERVTAGLDFALDGSVHFVVHEAGAPAPAAGTFASLPGGAREPAPEGRGALDGRWEYVAPGRSVARHCSGVVVARYYDRDTAAAARERTRSIVL